MYRSASAAFADKSRTFGRPAKKADPTPVVDPDARAWTPRKLSDCNGRELVRVLRNGGGK